MKRLLALLLLAALPATGQVLISSKPCKITDGSCASTGGSGTPGGADTQVQFNDAGSFAGSVMLTFQKASGALSGTGPFTLTPGADIVPLTVRAYSSGTSYIQQNQDSSNNVLSGWTHAGEPFLVAGKGAGKVLTSDANGVGTWGTAAGGITNGAGANVVPKSNGTNLVASTVTDDGTTLTLGNAGTTVTEATGALKAPTVTGSNLTSGRVPIVGASGLITDDSGLTYDAATDTLTTVNANANVATATTVKAVQPATITITNATNATPIEVTAVAHGLVTGDLVSISGITGNTNANGFFKVTKTGADTFTLQNYSTGANIAGNGAYGGAPVGVAGIVQAGKVLVGDGTKAAPSLAFASDPLMGFHKGASGFMGVTVGSAAPLVYFNANSTTPIVFTNGGSFTISGSVGATYISLGVVGSLADVFLRREAAATLQLGAAAAAAPVGQRLQAQGAVGTNLSGADLIVAAGGGTGLANTTAAGRRGDYKIRTQVRGTTGTTADTTGTDRFVAAGQVVVLTESSATPILDYGVASGTVAGGTVFYTIRADDGTDFQAIRGRVDWSAVNKAGTLTATLGTPVEVTTVSSGTLTNTATITTGTNSITINLNAVSSLSQTSLYAYVSGLSDGTGVWTTK